MNKRGIRYCFLCGLKLRKNGVEHGHQRWRCVSCGTSRVRHRKDVTMRIQLHGFVKVLLGVQPRKDTFVGSTHIPPSYSWCWTIIPKPVVTGEIYPYIIIDAKGIGLQAVAILRTRDFVVSWRFGQRENSDLWINVFNSIPRPYGVVCDGQTGIYKALRSVWPEIVIQRCMVHIKRNIRTKLTMHPQSEAGRDLAWLVAQMFKVDSLTTMTQFIAVFDCLYTYHVDFITEKTYYTDNLTGRTRWWYKHRKVRSAFRQIEKLIYDDELFAYITHPELNLPKTTNSLEGGINARLDELLYRHRGMTPMHQRRLVDWYLDSRTEQSYLARKNTVYEL